MSSNLPIDPKSDVYLAFNPNQFFYVSFAGDVPSDSSCKDDYLTSNNDKCSSITRNSNADAISECYKQQLCTNKKYANQINQLQNNHLGSGQNYQDTLKIYDNEYDKTINYVFSILFLIGAIYYTKTSSTQ
jgi:hypothetical protein